MKARHTAVMAGLVLGLMSGAATATPLTYDVDFTASGFGANSTVLGSITTDGAVGRSLSLSDIVSYTITTNGLAANSDFLQGNSLSATQSGKLVFDFDGSDSYFGFFAGNKLDLRFGADTGQLLANYDGASVVEEGVSGPFIVGSTLSAVPLPASAPMFGAALIVLGAVGYGLKRKRAAA